MGEKWSENGLLIHVMSTIATKATIIDTNRMLSPFEYMEKTKRMPVAVPRGWFQYVLGLLDRPPPPKRARTVQHKTRGQQAVGKKKGTNVDKIMMAKSMDIDATPFVAGVLRAGG